MPPSLFAGKVFKVKDLPGINDRDRVFEIYPQLVKFLRDCADTYYNQGNTLISDGEYDDLVDRLFDYEQAYPMIVDGKSPTRTVGSSIKQIRHLEKPFQHIPQMQSLSKFNDVDDLKHWFDKSANRLRENKIPLKDIFVSLEEKLDGVSLRVIYESGKLTHLVLRGDGVHGVDMISTIDVYRKRPDFKIAGLPLRLLPQKPDDCWDRDYKTEYLDVPESLDICGELVVTAENFKSLNKLLITNGVRPYPTPRHAAAALVNARSFGYLTFVMHTVNSLTIKNGRSKVEMFDDYSDDLDWLSIITRIRAVWHIRLALSNKNCWLRIYEELGFMETRRKLDPDIVTDGAVIKFTNKEHRHFFGKTRKYPKWAVAFKFPSEISTTKLQTIDWQIGSSGVLTPVANFEPVNINGVVLSRATLHNPNVIKNLDLRLNDTIFVQRANEVIPKILGVVVELRDPDSVPVEPPTICPYCGSPVTISTKTLLSSSPCCNNRLCRGRTLVQLLRCATRSVFNLMYVGERLITEMFTSGLVTRPEHFFQLCKESLLDKIKCTDAQATLIITAVEKTRKRFTPKMALRSLAIPEVGKDACDELFSLVTSLDDINVETLRGIKEIAHKVYLKNLIEYCEYPEIKASLEAYRKILCV